MSNNDIDSKVKELRELRRMADELNAEIEALTDGIKNEMAARETEELAGIDWKITWKLVNTRRFDAKTFKAKHGDLYEQFLTETATRRFVIA